MTEPALSVQPEEAPDSPPAPLTFGQILGESFRLYRQHGLAFTRRLLLPVLWIYLGAYTCLAFTFRAIEWMTSQDPLYVNHHPVIAFGTVGLICLVTLGCFCRGFWQYMVYWSSLNINAVEVMDNRPADFRAAYNSVAAKAGPYCRLLIAYCVFPLLALVPFFICSLIGARLDMHLQILLSVLGLLSSALAGLFCLVGLILLSLIFQVAAFEPLSDNPLAVFARSARLVWPRFWQVTGLQVIFYAVSNYAVPIPLWGLIQLLHADRPLNMLNQWLLARYLEWAVLPPQLALLAEWATRDLATTASNITGMAVMTAIVSLMLPLGTFAFARAYREATRKGV